MSDIFVKAHVFLNKYSSSTYTFLEVMRKQIREDRKNNKPKKQIQRSPTYENLFNNSII